MKRIIKICILPVVLSFILEACKKAGGNYPGDEYTFDMIHSKAFETYALNPLMADSVGALLPVSGTIPYSGDPIAGISNPAGGEINLPYQYANTPEDYERAGLEIKSPVAETPENILAGKYYYDIYCAICHGTEGDGQGHIVTAKKYTAAPPSYFADGYLSMPDGKMFHSITYGKGAMQSYAYALSKEDRWKVITYINSLQSAYATKNNVSLTTPVVVDSTKMN